MKPRSVTIIPVYYEPGEYEGFADGGWSADVMATYPDGDTFTKSTPVYERHASMMGRARAVQRDLLEREQG
jgi:hypothetical protein